MSHLFRFPRSARVTRADAELPKHEFIVVTDVPSNTEVIATRTEERTLLQSILATLKAAPTPTASTTAPSTVAVSNFPSTQPVNGTVNVGNLPATQPVSGTVNIGNLPATQPIAGTVALAAETLAALETVNVGNLPDVQPVSGTVAVSNLPETQPVSGTVALAASSAVIGHVIIDSMPAVGGTSTVGLTNTELRAAPVPVSATALPLPAGAATDASLGTDGLAAPLITGTGIRGWLRGIYEKLAGTLAVNLQNATVAVTGTFWPETQPVSGSVSVSNLPTTQAVSGTVGVNNFPATQAVSGTVSVSNFPATQPVSLATNTPDVTDRANRVLGSVSVSNLPATQPVSGTVSVGNFPATQAVSGSVAVSNFPATQPVSGTVAVSNFPATQPVSLATNTPDVTDRAARQLGVISSTPASLVATVVSTANAAATLTIPLVAGQFHYISRIIIERVATAAIAGSALLTYTSTNLNGWTRTTGNAAAVGQQLKDVDEVLDNELRSAVAGTNTTIAAPAAGATGIIRITVYYRTAA